MSTYAVIMAGGIGSRFWPKSRRAHPKQFLNVLGDASLIQSTINRLEGIIPPERCLVVTHERYVEETRRQLPDVPEGNILAEPISRNTAPCINYAAVKLAAVDPAATMVVLPADHVIKDVEGFKNTLHIAIEKAQDAGALVTIGITPTHPSTGYGYIQFDDAEYGTRDEIAALPVRTFAEKPDLATAERFLDSGDFLWNSGMFIWRADSILEQLSLHLPEAAALFDGVLDAIGTDREAEAVFAAFNESPKISIDYGVMERARHVYVVPGSFGWSDVGDWHAVYELCDKDAHGNALVGNVIVRNSSRCLVEGSDRLVVLIGMHDVAVIETEDATLVCHRNSTQQVKNVVEYMMAHQLSEYT